ncbi:class II aldolase/adducin family protein [Pseudomonas entomophila]|uniref:class II aldolase/adducin family protein n=1 Tax=Pseudomonas entomophila TaxID=312306 RepID=UPI0023D834AB|nr:class II aldolase/adducin family protein [Pseudomonas entomophila]MDF0729562.1 class II aldolase/adducin family protein [Pseudomonas entomophila]
MSVQATAAQQRELRLAARALGRAGLAHAYGHCSLRLDDNHFLVCAPRPMGLIGVDEPGTVVSIDGPLPEGVLGEVRIHQQLYRRRPDLNAVIRSMPAQVMALSCAGLTPRPRHGMGSYFQPSIPLWDDVQLLRDDTQAAALAERFGAGKALAMRGNGAIVAGDSLVEALTLTWYLEDAARIELQLHAAGLAEHGPLLDAQDCAQRATRGGRIYERMWEYLTAGDPEASNTVFE